MPDLIPVGWPIDYVEPTPTDALENLPLIVEHALARPVSSLPLPDLVGPGSRVTLVCAIHGHEHNAAIALMAPILLRELEAAGVRDEDITLLIPNALHPPSSDAEKRHSLGDAIVNRYRIVEHDASNQTELDDLGNYQGVPMQVNYHAVEANLLMALDIVQPHYYAGYSGGNKTVSIGCVGEATLNEVRTHRFLDDLAAHPADSPDNLAMLVEREIARRAGLMFVLNAVVDVHGQVMAVSAGAPNAVHDLLVRTARTHYEVDVPREDYNIIIAGDGNARVRTLYHASRAVVALGLAQMPVLVKGGVIILPLRCAGPAQLDERELQFYDALSGARDMHTVARQLSQRGIRTGEQRAYLLAQTLIARNYRVIVVGADCMDQARDCGLLAARDMLEAASLAEAIVDKKPRVLMLPYAAHLIPVNRWNAPRQNRSEDDEGNDIYIRAIMSDN